jgi:serine-type D-Ala-D-Ala carboxypeptidase/endopeptidase (penicillin-binding protein 4)
LSRTSLTRRGRIALRALALIALAIALTCAAIGVRDDAPAAATTADRRAAGVALLSARRMPYVFLDALARNRLRSSLEQHLAPYNACVAVDGPGPHTPDVRVKSDVPLAPASTLKLLTGAAALATLGPDHTFTTRAVVAADGFLTLIGGGDPVLSTPEYEARLHAAARTRNAPVTRLSALADAIVANGVRSVSTIVADDSRHDGVRFLPDWKPSYRDDIGPLGALTVDDGTAAGARVDDPALNVADRLRALLVARGVSVGGVARGTARPGAREVGSVTSPPVSDLVAAMLTSSDNLTAEMMTREIGIARGGDGSTSAGTHALLAALRDLGVPTTGVELHDGSGLAPADRATCRAILAAVDLVRDPKFAAIDHGLPVAGSTGTLVTRLRGDPLAGKLRAKTGNIEDVAGLAGIVDDDDHLHFAFIANGNFSTAQGQAIADQVARLVAAYPDAPPASDLVPAP